MEKKKNPTIGKIVDDKFEHLERDIDKLRQKHRMYISASNEVAAKNLVLEILYNSVDECRNPRSPGDKITVEFDERSGFIKITDNGRGIPTDILEMILTTLNSGSNIDSGAKEDLKTNVLGRNGTGTIAYTALAERVEVTAYRGGTENKFRRLVFVEGDKVEDKMGTCAATKHGMEVIFKPSKILGRNTRIVWNDVYQELVNFQYLETKKMNITSDYIDKDGNVHHEKYKVQEFKNIITHNDKENLISDVIEIGVSDDNIKEEFGGRSYKRFIDMKVAFAYTKNLHPYIDSFCNGNNTFDNGSHMDGAVEALCRYFQGATKNSMSEKERERLDVKWDDVKTGLSIAVVLNSNMEQLFTNQTKQKIDNRDLEKLLRDKLMDVLQVWGERNPNQLKEIINLVKMNAKVRREGDKVRNAVIKESVTNWKSFQMKNYDPCSNRGKEYKELYIIEGDSAKGSLKLARYPKFQALFAIRGVSANVMKLDLSGVLANKEFNDLIKVMGCNVGSKFDINKLAFDKIIIATDADRPMSA